MHETDQALSIPGKMVSRDAVNPEETTGLLATDPADLETTEDSASHSVPSAAAVSCVKPAGPAAVGCKSADMVSLCRICLVSTVIQILCSLSTTYLTSLSYSIVCHSLSEQEEDDPENLEIPCSCAGTQRWAHHACIQQWVSEKGNVRCEVCGTDYKGEFDVPPPPPPSAHPPPNLLAPMFILDADSAARIAATRHQIQVLEEQV